jgi:CubicO group peptidase (beta-lactamase class C family)
LFIGVLPSWAGEQGGGTSAPDASLQAQAPAPPAPAKKPDPRLKDKLAKFRLFLNAEMKRWEVPGMGGGIIKDGQVILAEGFGYRNAEKKLPVTPDTIFAIGSASKAFTTMDLGIPVEEGKVDCDKTVRTWSYSPLTRTNRSTACSPS